MFAQVLHDAPDRLDWKSDEMTESAPLTLHVPEPAVRPGGTPDFSNVLIPKAGSVARPAVDADPEHHRPVGADQAAEQLRRLIGDIDPAHQKKPSASGE
jgi:hypothetical protein